MLYNGERVGDGSGPEWDIAVDPVDGTTLTAKSLPDAVSVLGLSPRGTMFNPGPAVYMTKLVVPGAVASAVDLDAPIGDTLAKIAELSDRPVAELTVAILDRPRHAELVAAIRAAGARIRFLLDGDVAGAIMAVTPGTGVDLLVGTGGTPEGVLAACALRCLGGEMFGRLVARDDAERTAILDAGFDLNQSLTTRTWSRATTSSSPPPGSPTARCCAGSASSRTGSPPTRCRCARCRAPCGSSRDGTTPNAPAWCCGRELRAPARAAGVSSPTPQPGRAGRGAAPPGRRPVRRAGGRRRGDRLRRGSGRGHPRPARRSGRGPRPGRRHLQPVEQALPRRPALPRAAELRPGLRGAQGAPARAGDPVPAPGQAGAVPLPAHPPRVRPRVRGAGHRRLRRDGRRPRGTEPSPSPGPAEDPGVVPVGEPGGGPRGDLVLRGPGRRRPAHHDDRPDRGALRRRRGHQHPGGRLPAGGGPGVRGAGAGPGVGNRVRRPRHPGDQRRRGLDGRAAGDDGRPRPVPGPVRPRASTWWCRGTGSTPGPG